MSAETTADGRGHPWLGAGLILLTAISFGLNTSLSRLAYDDGSNPLTAVFVRVLGFVIFFAVYMTSNGRSFRLPARGFLAAAWLPIAMLVMSIGYLGSVAYIPVSLAALIFYLFPFYVAVLSSLLGREPLTTTKIVALIAAFVGLAFALGPGFDQLDWRGIAGALAAAVAFGTVIVLSGPIMRSYDVIAINWYTNLWMALLLGGYLVYAGGLALPHSATGLLGLAGGTVFYVIGFSTWLFGLSMVAPIRAAILLNLEPLVSIGAAWLLLGERLSATQGIGVALVIAAVMAVAVLGARTSSSAAT